MVKFRPWENLSTVLARFVLMLSGAKFLLSPQRDDSSLDATALLAKLDRKRRDRDGPKQFETSTFYTLVVKYGVY